MGCGGNVLELHPEPCTWYHVGCFLNKYFKFDKQSLYNGEGAALEIKIMNHIKSVSHKKWAIKIISASLLFHSTAAHGLFC